MSTSVAGPRDARRIHRYESQYHRLTSAAAAGAAASASALAAASASTNTSSSGGSSSAPSTATTAAAAAAGADVHAAALAASDEPPADWLALASLLLGVVGLLLRYKIAAWAALFACMASITTMKKKDMDAKQIVCSVLFAVMGLAMNYFNVKEARTPGAAMSGLFF